MDQEFLELANSCRKKTVSRYNSLVEVKSCSICGSNKSLESHHIKHQASAKDGFVDDGVRTHDASNLAVLCEHCHNEHHSGKLTIVGWKDTSQGRVLEFIRNTLIKKQTKEEPDMFSTIQDRLKSLLGKKKKEKDLLEILNAEFGIEAKIVDLRGWKKRLIL
jgi:hypothetical protein